MTSDAHWIYGRHAVAAALSNPNRHFRNVLLTRNAAEQIGAADAGRAEIVAPKAIDAALPSGAVHQGAAALADPLASLDIADVSAPAEPGRPVVVLDQISDPQNIGAIFRSAAAFGARALVAQDRKTPPFAGALAKAAAGAVEALPAARVVNIARAIEELQELGYLAVGLAGDTSETLADIPGDRAVALVLGAEGSGLRRLTRERCDLLARIPIAPAVESLNVSAAAAVALYSLGKGNASG